MRSLMTLCIAVSLFSCGGAPEEGNISMLDPNFFNLKEFVEAQREVMAGKSIQKTVSVNGIEETKALADVDWALELAPFEQSNIDKAALWEKYSVDTLMPSKFRFTALYTSLDSNSFTKTLKVIWSDTALPKDSVYALQIQNGFDSYLATTKQQISWWNGGYEILSTQDAVLSEKRELKIRAEWASDFDDPFSAGMPTLFGKE